MQAVTSWPGWSKTESSWFACWSTFWMQMGLGWWSRLKLRSPGPLGRQLLIIVHFPNICFGFGFVPVLFLYFCVLFSHDFDPCMRNQVDKPGSMVLNGSLAWSRLLHQPGRYDGHSCGHLHTKTHKHGSCKKNFHKDSDWFGSKNNGSVNLLFGKVSRAWEVWMGTPTSGAPCKNKAD